MAALICDSNCGRHQQCCPYAHIFHMPALSPYYRRCGLHTLAAHTGDAAKAYGSVLPNRLMALLGPRFLPSGAPRGALRCLPCTSSDRETGWKLRWHQLCLQGICSSSSCQPALAAVPASVCRICCIGAKTRVDIT